MRTIGQMRKPSHKLISFAFAWLIFTDGPCCIATQPEEIYSSEYVFIGQYEKYEEPIPHENYARMVYSLIDVVKGPPWPRRPMYVKCPIVTEKSGSDDASILPPFGSKWIVFLRYSAPSDNRGTFEMLDEITGRIEYSRKNLDSVLDEIGKTKRNYFSAPIRQLLYTKIEKYPANIDYSVSPILFYVRGKPLPHETR